MRIHNKKSYLTAQTEGKPTRRFWPRVTQLLYVFLILFIFGYLLYFFIARSLFLVEDGVVEIDKQRVSATHGGRIQSLDLSAGAQFKQGQTIAVIDPARHCSPALPNNDSDKLKFDIREQEIELTGLIRELVLLKKQQESREQGSQTIRRALELTTPLMSASKDSDFELQEKQLEIDLQRLKLETLREKLAFIVSRPSTVETDPACFAETIKAPFDGYVFSVSKVENEVVNRGESFISIVANDANVVVQAQVKNELFDSVTEQSQFTVTLPDGYQSQAFISKLTTSAINKNDREWDNYSHIIPQIQIELSPVESTDIDRWKKYDRFRVAIEGLK